MSTKFESLIIDIHLDNILKSIKNAPTRCLNRLIDLGCEISNNSIISTEREKLVKMLEKIIKNNNKDEIKKWFKETFFN